VLQLDQRVAHERLAHICCIDYDRELALVAEQEDAGSGERKILGVARLTRLQHEKEAEFAIVIADHAQRQGLGTELLRRLVAVARAEKIERLTADIMAENTDMRRIAKKLGFELQDTGRPDRESGNGVGPMNRTVRTLTSCMRPFTVVATCALLTSVARAATQEPIDHSMIARIRAEGLERSRVLEVFDTLTLGIGPRLTGSPAHRRAAEWARDWLTRNGLANAHLEPFEFGRGWSLEAQTLELVAPRFAPLIGYAEAWTPSTRGVVQGHPVYVGNRTAPEIEAMTDRLRGAIVLALQPQTVFTRADRPQPTTSEGSVRTGAPPRAPGEMGVSAVPANELSRLLQQAGAAVVLRPSRGEHGTVFVLGNRATRNDAVPTLILAAEHYNDVVRMVEAGARPELRVEVRSRYHEDDPMSYNVLAELPGTDPMLRNEVVLLGAHLDSWHAGAGAADNADGVAVAMEAVRILSAVGARPRRTIRVALWGGEEQGLLGSHAYVARHLSGQDSTSARNAIAVYLNDDPGSGSTYGFYMEGNSAAKAIFDAWLEPLRELGIRRNVLEGIPSTDHLSFTRIGVPGFTAIKEYANYDQRMHHTNMDVHDRVRADDLKQSAVVLACFAWHAATRKERIPRASPARP
jgi:RimJ/RimL family protein N-acetyltransferase/Iap family predicted aminopeptidase